MDLFRFFFWNDILSDSTSAKFLILSPLSIPEGPGWGEHNSVFISVPSSKSLCSSGGKASFWKKRMLFYLKKKILQDIILYTRNTNR